MSTKKINAAIIGSGNIGTDLLIKFHKRNKIINIVAMAGIDPASKGLATAKEFGAAITAEGVEGLVKLPEFADIKIVFDATSAQSHIHNDEYLRKFNPKIRMIDLTPAAIGPYHIPVASPKDNLKVLNLNMVTCGGQATVPIVYAISRVAKVHYAEIIASISSLSAGPGTRANIDEFTVTTSKALEKIGGAQRGKAIIILNPANPPVLMRDTIYTLSDIQDQNKIKESVESIVKEIQAYVPGYRLKQEVQFEIIPEDRPINVPEIGYISGLKTTVFIEVEGAADFLPSYAGNLDIMTSSALITAEQMAEMID